MPPPGVSNALVLAGETCGVPKAACEPNVFPVAADDCCPNAGMLPNKLSARREALCQLHAQHTARRHT